MKQQSDTTNWRRLSPGTYVDPEGVLHFVIPEMLAELGFPDTPQNREDLARYASQFLREELPTAELTTAE
ncbi:MAG: hypothetical protein ACR2GW_07150 [Pyrinomonadaceae bacterium]|jgi:hypothetical protein